MARLRVLACVLLVTAGCGSRRLEAQRPAAQAKIADFEAVGELLKQTAPGTTMPLNVDGPAPNFPPCHGHENAVVIGSEYFADLTEITAKSKLVPLNPIGGVACWAKKGVTPLGKEPDPDDYLRRVETLLRLRYVLVVRPVRLTEPQILGSGEFVGGTCAAEILLFDLDQKKLVGAMGAEGSNTSNVTVPPGIGNVPEWLMENLRKVTFAGPQDAFKTRFPDATPPF